MTKNSFYLQQTPPQRMSLFHYNYCFRFWKTILRGRKGNKLLARKLLVRATYDRVERKKRLKKSIAFSMDSFYYLGNFLVKSAIVKELSWKILISNKNDTRLFKTHRSCWKHFPGYEGNPPKLGFPYSFRIKKSDTFWG